MNSKKLKLKKEIVLQILIVGIWIWLLIKEWVLYKVLINFVVITKKYEKEYYIWEPRDW